MKVQGTICSWLFAGHSEQPPEGRRTNSRSYQRYVRESGHVSVPVRRMAVSWISLFVEVDMKFGRKDEWRTYVVELYKER